MKRKTLSSGYQMFMLALCVYALFALGLETFISIDEETRQILAIADLFICGLFLFDFVLNLVTAPSRWKYMASWGWVDLASSIPAVGFLRWGRAARVVRILRIFRGIRATKILASFFLEKRAESAFMVAALISILLIIFSSIAILQFEVGTDTANIKTAEDALWWSAVTITTVGYGDRFPVTTEGRVIAVILMVAGVGLFGAFSGFVASWFISPGQKADETELVKLREDVRELKSLLESQSGRA